MKKKNKHKGKNNITCVLEHVNVSNTVYGNLSIGLVQLYTIIMT